MPSPNAAPFPNDFAAMALTMACADELLHLEGVTSSYSYEALRYGVRKREYSTPTTLGSMARNRNGNVIVSHERLEEWIRLRPELEPTARSVLWNILRAPRALLPNEISALEPKSRAARGIAFIGMSPASVQSMIADLSACGTFDSIAVLTSLLVQFKGKGNDDFAFSCARYVSAALRLVAASPGGRRVALPIFALLRHLLLDDMRWQGQRLDLSTYDVLAFQESAARLPPVRIELGWRIDSYKRNLLPRKVQYIETFEVPAERHEWVQLALPPVRAAKHPGGRSVWRSGLSPKTHPHGPCLAPGMLHIHPRGVERMQRALGKYA